MDVPAATEPGLELVGPYVAAEPARLRRVAPARELVVAALRLAAASIELLRELDEAA